MVAGRTHQRERAATRERLVRGVERGGHGATRVLLDAGEIRRVVVDVRTVRDALEERRGVRGEEDRLVEGAGLAPFPLGVRGAQMGYTAGDAGGLLRPHVRAVFRARRIVKENHELCPPTDGNGAEQKT
jgi:hypothetical protein